MVLIAIVSDTVIHLEPGKGYRVEAELRESYGFPKLDRRGPECVRIYGNDQVVLSSNNMLTIGEKTPSEIKSKLVELATKL